MFPTTYALRDDELKNCMRAAGGCLQIVWTAYVEKALLDCEERESIKPLFDLRRRYVRFLGGGIPLPCLMTPSHFSRSVHSCVFAYVFK